VGRRLWFTGEPDLRRTDHREGKRGFVCALLHATVLRFSSRMARDAEGLTYGYRESVAA